MIKLQKDATGYLIRAVFFFLFALTFFLVNQKWPQIPDFSTLFAILGAGFLGISEGIKQAQNKYWGGKAVPITELKSGTYVCEGTRDVNVRGETTKEFFFYLTGRGFRKYQNKWVSIPFGDSNGLAEKMKKGDTLTIKAVYGKKLETTLKNSDMSSCFKIEI